MSLPPANEVWGKVIFLHLFVILFKGGRAWLRGGGHAWLQGGVHGCGGMCGGGVHGHRGCMVAGGMHGCGGVCGCGGGCRGMYGCRGACMVAGVCMWLWGVCVVVGGHA